MLLQGAEHRPVDPIDDLVAQPGQGLVHLRTGVRRREQAGAPVGLGLVHDCVHADALHTEPRARLGVDVGGYRHVDGERRFAGFRGCGDAGQDLGIEDRFGRAGRTQQRLHRRRSEAESRQGRVAASEPLGQFTRLVLGPIHRDQGHVFLGQ